MEREIYVFVDIERDQIPVGTLWTRSWPGRESASFEYDRTWLGHPQAFPLGPSLPLGRGQFHTKQALFAAFTDAAPDRWGEVLLQRAENKRNKKLAARQLRAADHLIGVEDTTRMGALRFKASPDGEFLSHTGKPVPPLIELRRLLVAAQRVSRDRESDEDLEILLAPGSSLGGQRPKANVADADGSLLIAKFPKDSDKWSVPRWEAATLSLAQQGGVVVPPWRLVHPTKTKPALLAKRFDREGVDVRIPFMSALCALDAQDNEAGSYLDIAAVLRTAGIAPTEDLQQLWRRMLFNILVSNADDHLRNHGFLWRKGWRLSPAYDLNPCPEKRGFHATAFDETTRDASLDVALSVAASFALSQTQARTIAGEVGFVVRNWKTEAKKFGIGKPETERMSIAFEHQHLRQALAMRSTPSGGGTGKPRARKQARKTAASTPRA